MNSSAPEQPGEKTAELPPDLAALEAEAKALETTPAPDTVTPGQGPASESVAVVDWEEDSRGLVNIAAEALGGFYPSTAPILDDKARGRIAGALAPVMQKYGWSLAAVFGKYGAEIQLAFVASQYAIPIAKAIAADRAQARAAKAAEKPAAPVQDQPGHVAQAPVTDDPGATLYQRA